MSDIKARKSKFDLNKFLRDFKNESIKALDLGKKMFSAGRTSTELKDTLSQLGLAFYQQQKSADNSADNSTETQEIKNLMKKVDYLEKLMESHEGEIQRLKSRTQPS